MLRATLDRVAGIEARRPAVVVCNEAQAPSVRREMRAAGHGEGLVIVEPEGRNTAPAVAVAAHAIDDRDALLLVMPADHVIRDTEAFTAAVTIGAVAAADGALVTFGIVPTHPATGYGYIRQERGDGDVRPVAEFVEKPDLLDAERFLADGGYLWNSGMFMFTAGRYLDELARFEPAMASAAQAAVAAATREDSGAMRLDPGAFAASPANSIDYAVMERTDRAVVVPLDAGWSDVGSWASLMDVALQDRSGNVIVGDVVAEDVDGSYLRSDGGLLAVVGLSDVVAVATSDAVLVAARDRAEDVKQIVDRLRRRERAEADRSPSTVHVWGTTEVLARVGSSIVAKVTIDAGEMAGVDGAVQVVLAGTARHRSGTLGPGTALPDGEGSVVANDGPEPLVLLTVSWERAPDR